MILHQPSCFTLGYCGYKSRGTYFDRCVEGAWCSRGCRAATFLRCCVQISSLDLREELVHVIWGGDESLAYPVPVISNRNGQGRGDKAENDRECLHDSCFNGEFTKSC